MPKLPKRNPRYLPTDKVSHLIHTSVARSRNPERVRNWTMIAFLFHTGLRVSEFCGMKMADISYCEGLPQSIRVIGKGNKERRVALSPEAKRALYQWLQERAHIEAQVPIETDTSFVWLIPVGRKRGQPISPGGVRAVLRRLGKLAAIPDGVHPHLLRHSFGTEAVLSEAVPSFTASRR